MKPEGTSTCQACGARVPVGLNFCPVCAFRGALEEGQETVELKINPTPSLSFEHYQILTREDGTPLELGRGAMGLTYKAFDIDLRLPVALKVISEKYAGDESARLRFLREARAAAKVRHTNVASVLHLGRTGSGYFYAMEFVQGETLESLMKRSGRLEVRLALEIAAQVAAGLDAVQKQNLVHRDIKPSNIMVSLEEGGGVTTKIIDLGLARGVGEAAPESAISVPGGFAGTPEFASPEQFAGVGVDIRSDLYSLGVTLWVMLTGRPPFRGTPAELTYQHQHGVLPLEYLKSLPQEVAALLERLLDKDPRHRFQTPAELLKTLLMVTHELQKSADQKHEVQKPQAQKSTVITEQLRPEPVCAEGLIEVSSDGLGFLREPKRNYVRSQQDISVTPEVVRKHALRDGLWIKGETRRGSRGSELFRLTEINGEHPDRYRNLPEFEELTSLNPKSRIRLETVPDRYSTRVMDLMTPVGKGQRGLIVAPPHTGKTTLLQHIANGVVQNHPEVNLVILLIDERREEVTEMRRTVPQADIMASSNDNDFRGHIRIAQLAIARAKRLAEAGKDVFVLMDSLTRLGRAFNNTISDSGRAVSDRMNARAMELLRNLFAAARNTEEAGSLTIMATVLIETRSKMDELIFQEFKGTGHMEIVLDRHISDQRVYPAIDVFKSGTRREELLIPANELEKINTIRRGLAGRRPVEAIERLLSCLRKFPTNAQMVRGNGSGRAKPQKRSVAVLPFESLSASKKDTYFADGVQDEILSNLAKISQLKVISRSSVMTYRPGANRNLRAIANELGVARVIEGTVRRSGNRVRIATRLVDAQTGEALWSESYDRSVSDIFAIQSEIARNVAARLSAQLAPEERKEIEEKPTNNLEAYDLYLQAKQQINRGCVGLWSSEKETYSEAIRLLEQAIQRDPQFALAYCRMADAHGLLYQQRIDHTSERRALSDAAINEAMRLRPDLPEVHLAMAWHLWDCYRDIERAGVQIAIAAQNLPNNPDLLHLAAVLDRHQGRWDNATAGLERAATLDPRNPDLLHSLAWTYRNIRRYQESARILDRLIATEPDQKVILIERAECAFYEKADLETVRAAFRALPASVKNDPDVNAYRVYYAMCARDFAAAKEILEKAPTQEFFWHETLIPLQILAPWVEFLRGNRPTMDEFGAVREQLNRQIETEPSEPYLVMALALTDVALGRVEQGIEEGRRAMTMRPISGDAVDGPMVAANFALVCAWANQPDLAFEQLDILVQMPGWFLNYGNLKTYPGWDPLRNNPRFEKLLTKLAPHQILQKTHPSASRDRTNKRSERSGPKKISVARLPVTGSDLFGREEDIAFLDRAWANKDINVVTIIAWGGAGKSTLTNHWLRKMGADHYRCAELVFGWSFYRQGTSGDTSSADEFFDAALTWFGDPDPRLGTAWEKGERLAKLIAHRRALLVLDGLEPLQNPPGPQEGRLREPSLQALLRELAAFNKGLCVITTRTAVADIVDHERTSALRRDLEQLSSDAGAQLLRALGVEGDKAELRSASDEFSGHCLALTLLGSYLSDAYNGDIRCRGELSGHLAHDVRQGAHARKIMESYQTWFGEGPELAVLRMLGLFDRPADEKAIAALRELPAIPGLTECLIDSSQIEWRTIIARLRRARLLAAEDPNDPGQLDAHPLVREYFGEQLRTQRTSAWKESNRRLFNYYQTLARELPETFKEMEPLFLAVIHGCNAGLFREALREVYMPRIQRGEASFVANTLGARGTLLLVLSQFFENGRWESPVVKGDGEHSLTEEDELYILLQTGEYLCATRGFGAPAVRVCYERAESLCHALNRPSFLYISLMGQWRHSCATEKGAARLELAQRIYSLACQGNEVGQLIGACCALAMMHYFLGDFEASYQYAIRGFELWRSRGSQSTSGELELPGIACLRYLALCRWHNDDIISSQATIEEAISLARELNDMHGLAVAIDIAASLACDERNLTKVEFFSSQLIELSTRHGFAVSMAIGGIYRGWGLCVAGKSVEGIRSIEQGLKDLRATGELEPAGYYLGLRAEALYLADRGYEALEAIKEAELLSERFGGRAFTALLLRLRGVVLAAVGADETQIEFSFCEAVRVAKQQKSLLWAKRADATLAEYRRQRASAAGGRGFRLPL